MIAAGVCVNTPRRETAQHNFSWGLAVSRSVFHSTCAWSGRQIHAAADERYFPVGSVALPTLRTFPQISSAAMARKRDRPLLLWYLARHLDETGSGRVNANEVVSSAVASGFCSVQTARRWIEKGNGLFWTVNGKLLWLRGLFTVAEDLGIDRLSDRAVLVASGALRGVAETRAVLASTVFFKPRMVSRATLAQEFGCSMQTARRRLKQGGVVAGHNVMRSARSPRYVDDEQRRQGWFLTTIKGQRALVRRLVNTYTANVEVAGVGMVKHAHKRRSSSLLTRGAPATQRLYFTNPNAAVKAMHRGAATGYLKTQDRDACGATVWEGQMVVEGGLVLTQ